MQALIEKIEGKELTEKFNTYFNPLIKKLMLNQNTIHIIDKYVVHIPNPGKKHLYQVLNENFLEIVCDKYGCCIFNNCLLQSSKNQKKIIFSNIIQYLPILVTNMFGNFVIQNILARQDQQINTKIIDELTPDLVSFCKDKFGSRVIEKVRIFFLS